MTAMRGLEQAARRVVEYKGHGLVCVGPLVNKRCAGSFLSRLFLNYFRRENASDRNLSPGWYTFYTRRRSSQ